MGEKLAHGMIQGFPNLNENQKLFKLDRAFNF